MMLFVVTGQFKADAEAKRQEIHERFGEHLRQPQARVRLGGPTFDVNDRCTGVLLIVEVIDHAAAEAFLRSSPYEMAGLYEHTEIIELRPSVGYVR